MTSVYDKLMREPWEKSNSKRPCFLIKKKFFEQILAGTKKIEYRDDTARNRKLVKDMSLITLLCGQESAIFRVVRVKRVWGKIAITIGHRLRYKARCRD